MEPWPRGAMKNLMRRHETIKFRNFWLNVVTSRGSFQEMAAIISFLLLLYSMKFHRKSV